MDQPLLCWSKLPTWFLEFDPDVPRLVVEEYESIGPTFIPDLERGEPQFSSQGAPPLFDAFFKHRSIPSPRSPAPPPKQQSPY